MSWYGDFQIQWLFNDRPVHGKDFLVSVSGDRQVLTIPETGSTHVGTISCVAENAAGKAICSARLDIGKQLNLTLTILKQTYPLSGTEEKNVYRFIIRNYYYIILLVIRQRLLNASITRTLYSSLNFFIF